MAPSPPQDRVKESTRLPASLVGRASAQAFLPGAGRRCCLVGETSLPSVGQSEIDCSALPTSGPHVP